MTTDRPLPGRALWAAVWFSAALSALTVVGTLAVYATTGTANPSMLLVFLCNLPMAFLFAAYPVRQAHERIHALEGRIRELEAARPSPG